MPSYHGFSQATKPYATQVPLNGVPVQVSQPLLFAFVSTQRSMRDLKRSPPSVLCRLRPGAPMVAAFPERDDLKAAARAARAKELCQSPGYSAGQYQGHCHEHFQRALPEAATQFDDGWRCRSHLGGLSLLAVENLVAKSTCDSCSD